MAVNKRGGEKRDYKSKGKASKNKVLQAHYRDMAKQGKVNIGDGNWMNAPVNSHMIKGYKF
jgi:hypothetical protein